MLRLLFLLPLLGCTAAASAQVYLEKQTRHRFAQLNLGLDVQAGFGGTTRYADGEGGIGSLALRPTAAPRFLIGGTHFWGHADFYIGIPLLDPSFTDNGLEVTAARGVETVLKVYPWRIERGKLRPFVGAAITPFSFAQRNENLTFPEGPRLNRTDFPLVAGLTYNSGNHLFEFGLSWNYANSQDYYVSRTRVATIDLPPVYANLSYRYQLETTLSAERDWESGRTRQVTEALAERGDLNGWYAGVGISAAFWLGRSSYNDTERPYVGDYGISTMPDFTLGYYLHGPDLNLALGYRGYRATAAAYGADQEVRRRSVLLEATKYLFDYHGFVPFLGPALSYERLRFNEEFENLAETAVNDQRLTYGLTFGWDIRPNRIQHWILRTNLRWWPDLSLDLASDQAVSFNNLEFNFIQLVIFPGRIW